MRQEKQRQTLILFFSPWLFLVVVLWYSGLSFFLPHIFKRECQWLIHSLCTKASSWPPGLVHWYRLAPSWSSPKMGAVIFGLYSHLHNSSWIDCFLSCIHFNNFSFLVNSANHWGKQYCSWYIIILTWVSAAILT